MSRSKVFSPDHDMYGQEAEEKVVEYLDNLDLDVERYPFGQKDVDIRCEDWYLDVERRTNWGTGKFPFDTIHVPERKREMIDRRKPFFYVAVCNDLDYAILIPGDVILASPVISIRTRYTSTLDDFFDIKVDDAWMRKLD